MSRHLRIVVNLVLAAAVLVAAGLAWKLFKPLPTEERAPMVMPVVVPCAEASAPIPLLRPDLSAATVRVVGELSVTIDDAAPTASLAPGRHVVATSGARLQVLVAPFASVIVDARSVAGLSTLLVLGAACATCQRAETELNFSRQSGVVGSTAALAAAVARADWSLAAQQVRGLSDEERLEPEIIRLMATIHQLAGRPSEARGLLETLPKKDVLHEALRLQDRDEVQAAARKFATASERWNAVSNRYQRLSDAYVGDAPRLMTELSARFDAYSVRLLSAITAKNQLEAEAVLREANETLEGSVRELRALHGECEWQRALSKRL